MDTKKIPGIDSLIFSHFLSFYSDCIKSLLVVNTHQKAKEGAKPQIARNYLTDNLALIFDTCHDWSDIPINWLLGKRKQWIKLGCEAAGFRNMGIRSFEKIPSYPKEMNLRFHVLPIEEKIKLLPPHGSFSTDYFEKDEITSEKFLDLSDCLSAEK